MVPLGDLAAADHAWFVAVRGAMITGTTDLATGTGIWVILLPVSAFDSLEIRNINNSFPRD